ncbi:phosphopantothenoylcysteine decarboxylase [Palaemon carinicauda]|uniref:phosphopantothenoylcysteine decarboxylase n=1 Tax=Palaemon carinicauda TaxID=392227 RepID=UPI0035B5C47D
MAQLPPLSAGPRVVLGCTGSVATIKVPELARKLQNRGASVVIVPTERACHFLRCQAKVEPPSLDLGQRLQTNLMLDKKTIDNGLEKRSSTPDSNRSSGRCSRCGAVSPPSSSLQSKEDSALRSLYPDLNFILDEDEWSAWQGRGDPVLHIALRDWAQVLVIAPLDANTMAKIAQGLCDNLLTCIVRAWNVSYPLVFCPAMNTQMYKHPLTVKHTAILKELGYIEVCVVSKRLACGDVGVGGMAEVGTIVDAVMQELPGAQRVHHGPF